MKNHLWPVAVKVKSKKAELFFLQKTEATEIFNRYSNIWKRIVNRSLHIMKQIKNLIRKKVLLYIESNNIKMDDELQDYNLIEEGYKISYNSSEKIKKNNSPTSIDTIIEEKSNVDKSKISAIHKKKQQSTSTSTLTKNIKIHDINDSKEPTNYISKLSSKKKVKKVFFKSDIDKIDKIKTEIKENSQKNEVNDVINLFDERLIKSSQNNNLINNFNINIYTQKVQFPLNQINIEKQNSNIYEIKKKKAIKKK